MWTSTLANANKVILVHSYHHDYPWVGEYRSGFVNTLEKAQLLEYDMDTKRQPFEKFPLITRNTLEFIDKHLPDVVVLADDNALNMLGSALIKKKIPIVFLGINNNPRQYIPLGKHVTGVLERPLIKRSIASLKKIDPNLIKVKVVTDATVTSNAIIETVFQNNRSQDIQGIQVDIISTRTLGDWKNEVLISKNQGYQALFMAVYARLEQVNTQHQGVDEISQWTSTNSPIPVYGFWAFSVAKDKAIGGLLISGFHQGIEAASKVNFFLKNGYFTRISTPQRGQYIFSQHQLKRWNITLPKMILDQAILID